MADVKKKKIKWTTANDADIVTHRVVVAPEDVELTKETQPFVDIAMPEAEIVLPDAFPAGTFSAEGNYHVGVFSVDDVGNTSDIAVVASPFDFIAPGAPTDLIVENV